MKEQVKTDWLVKIDLQVEYDLMHDVIPDETTRAEWSSKLIRAEMVKRLPSKDKIGEIAWDMIQCYIQNDPHIVNEDMLEGLLSGVEDKIAGAISTKVKSALTKGE